MRALIAVMAAFYGYQPATTWWLTTDLYRALVDLQVSQPNVVPPGGPAYIWLAMFAVACWGVADAIDQGIESFTKGQVYIDPFAMAGRRNDSSYAQLGGSRAQPKASADNGSGTVQKAPAPEAPSTPQLLRMPSKNPAPEK